MELLKQLPFIDGRKNYRKEFKVMENLYPEVVS